MLWLPPQRRAVGLSDPKEGLRLTDEGLGLISAAARFDRVFVECQIARGNLAMRLESPALVSSAAQAALQRLAGRPRAFPELRATALHLVAMSHRLAGETMEADRAFAQTFEQFRALGREDSSTTATLLNNWASNTALTNPLAALEQNRRVIVALAE